MHAQRVIQRLGAARAISGVREGPSQLRSTEPMDASAVLWPAVVVLRLRGMVVWVDSAVVPVTRVHLLREGSPVLRRVVFDAVELRPCHVEDLAAAYEFVCGELGWSPRPRRASGGSYEGG